METPQRRRNAGRGSHRDRIESLLSTGKLVRLAHQLDEYGDAIEADLLREYGVDLLDFYRGDLSVRRLGVLVRQLSADSALSRARNGGLPPLTLNDHLVADLWFLIGNRDNPRREAIEERARVEAKEARVAGLRAVHENRKRTYRLR